MKKLIIAVDFDGTITKKNEYPKVGKADKKVTRLLRIIQKYHDLVLWTARHGDKDLAPALELCYAEGLHFVAINDHHPLSKMQYKEEERGRKIYANFYIDDHSVINRKYIYKLLKHIIRKYC